MADILSQRSIFLCIALFVLAAVLIAVFGIKMTYLARDLARLTGLGEAFVGAVFIGIATSLSGIFASGTAAWHGEGALAISNSLGGIAAQTLFLVLADLMYRKSNLEFAAASVENMMMAAQLMLLLCILIIAFTTPAVEIFSVHPVSILLFVAYAVTLKMLVNAHEQPMWLPRMSRGTITEKKAEPVRAKRKKGKSRLVGGFLVCALVVAFSGWLIAIAGTEIINRNEISAGVMGGIFMAISTSLPELIIAITAVRMGALTLAVGDIIGGNAFDTLFIAVADLFYRNGSIYLAVTTEETIWLCAAMVMNSLLLLGLMYRQRKGFANIGMESLFIFLTYVGTVIYLCF